MITTRHSLKDRKELTLISDTILTCTSLSNRKPYRSYYFLALTCLIHLCEEQRGNISVCSGRRGAQNNLAGASPPCPSPDDGSQHRAGQVETVLETGSAVQGPHNVLKHHGDESHRVKEI